MAQQSTSRTIFSVFLVVLSLNLAQIAAETMQTWCVAKPSASDSLLLQDIDYACSHVDDKDCNPIRQGSDNPCYIPNTLVSHATFAINIYYQRNGMHQWNCNFENSALISLTDPSYGDCLYQGGETYVELSSVGMWCVASAATREETLKNNIQYACNHVDCSAISDRGVCYNPSSLISHASFVMNLYYQATGRPRSSCDFMGSGLIVTSDPSYGSCIFEYRK